MTKIFLSIPDSLKTYGTYCGALYCGYLWYIVSKAFLLLLLLRKASMKTQSMCEMSISKMLNPQRLPLPSLLLRKLLSNLLLIIL